MGGKGCPGTGLQFTVYCLWLESMKLRPQALNSASDRFGIGGYYSYS
jgi:hypothetical protein